MTKGGVFSIPRQMLTKYWWWVFLALVWVLFTWVGYSRLDPDFGWHIMMGELIIEQGRVPATDPFSYTMPSFAFVDHEWLTNVLMYLGYTKFGYEFLAGVFGLLVATMIGLIVPKERRVLAMVPILMAIPIFIARAGVRPQVQSWLYLAVLVRLFYSQAWSKIRWLVPVGLVVWANLHGSFVLGVCILGFMVFWKIFEKRKVDWVDVLVVIVSTLATLINPYGWRVWFEVWMQMSDSGLKCMIVEWQPFFMKVELGFLMLGVLVVWTGIKFRKDMRIGEVLLVWGLFLAGLNSLRHVALFAVVAIWVVPELFLIFKNKFVTNSIAEHRSQVVYGILLLVSIVGLGIFSGIDMWIGRGSKYGESAYPTKAIEFLKQQNYAGNVFSEYGWGGYLIWKYPEKKVFVDGRMPSWRWGVWPEPERFPPDSESNWAFDDYKKVIFATESGEIKEIFEKFDVRVVVWPGVMEDKSLMSKIEEILKDWIGQNKENKQTWFDLLENARWESIYDDDVAVIYKLQK